MPPENHETNPERTRLPLARPIGRPRTKLIARLSLLLVAGLLVGVFAAAAWINPYGPDGRPRTMGTHTQLGMLPCNFVILTGRPCPSCGMTTSFALLVRGEGGLRRILSGDVSLRAAS